MADPRAALEALLDACTGCGCLGETHAHRAEQALRAVLDLCDKADDGVVAPYYRAVETTRIRRAITTALEGKK